MVIQSQKSLLWSGISLILVGALLILSSDTVSLSAQEPSPTETTLPPPIIGTPTPTEATTAPPTDIPTVTASPTPTDTVPPTATLLPTDSDTPSPIPVLPTETVLATLPVTIPPVSPTVDIASTPTLTPETWTFYQDSDPRLTYASGTWQTFAVTGAAGGTLTGSADPGATLTVAFNGTGIRVVYARGPEGRTFTGQVDGGAMQSGDTYSDTYSYGHILAFDNLPTGDHRLTVTNGDGAIWIEELQIQGTLLALVEPETPTPEATPTLAFTPTPAGDYLLPPPFTAPGTLRLPTITINVSNVTELIDAVASSNSDCGVHTIIEMAYGTYSLTAPTDTSFFGANGLKVSCTLTINGHDATLTRNAGTDFRIIGVGAGASLTLNNVTVSNGRATDVGGSGVLNVQGSVTINQSRITSNTAAVNNGYQILGGGVYSYYGDLTIEESEIYDNVNSSLVGDGGGIGVIAGTATITRSDIRNNFTTRDGGGIAMLYNRGGTVDKSCIAGNNRISLFGNLGAYAQNNWWGDTDGPLLDQYSTGTRDSVNSAVTYMPYQDTQPSDCTPGVALTLADFGIVTTGNWNQDELDAMLAAAMLTGQAFQSQYGEEDSPANKFNEVMYLPGRDTIEIVRSTQSGYYCTTDNNNVAGAQQAVITCDTNVIVTEYTIVHELGHVLVGRTGGYTQQDPNAGNAATLYALAESGTISDGSSYLVFGYYFDQETQTDQWERGNRGWGSSSVRYSDSQACDYQQNPTVEDGRTSHEVDEGIADMFLNWSFDEVNGGIYKNIDWRQATSCVLTDTADPSNPGDARSGWMNNTMTTLGNARGW